MGKVEEFLAEMLPRLEEADRALHNGNPELRKAIWSHNDPVTLFGAVATKSGWNEIGPTFDWLASTFSNCESFKYEVVAADVSGDLAYIAGIEHTRASVGGAPAAPYSLRVTTILRREDGNWKVIHRHGDPVPDSDSTAEQLGLLKTERDAQ
jgi:ketosteroid isomerase-like protein